MIKLKNIDRYIDKRFERNFILKGIDLVIEEGDFVTVMGPSGAGKSTLLNIIGFLDDADEGEYEFNGEPVQGLSERRRTEYHKSHIGFVFQAYHLIDEMTVYENIEMPLLYRKVKSKKRKAMVADMLDRFNIVAKKDLFPAQLSGGQQQVVGVARALIGNPKLILADEPTGNLHSEQSEQIMELFTKLNQEEGVTIIQVTHSEKMASYGKRILNLKDGAIVNENPYEEGA
jgi:ABC-type lipoprotein export system ATPase subunit